MPTVGEILQAEREKRGLTVKDIEKQTSIRALYLQAIEEANYSVVPGEVYLKGFIRNYAKALGLDGPEMVALYKKSQQPEETEPLPAGQDSSDKGADAAAQQVTADKPAAAEAPKVAVEPRLQSSNKSTMHKIASQRSSKNGGSKKIIAVVAVVLILGGGGFYAWHTANVPVPAAGTSVTQSQQKQATKSVPSATQSQPVAVSAKYDAPCWTSVKADGKQIYEGTPKAGETQTWNGQKEVEVRLGNAGVVDFTYNGNDIGKIGKKGEVIVKKFMPQ